MKWVIFLLIVFFIFLILSQLFLKYIQHVVEGMEDNSNFITTPTTAISLNAPPSTGTSNLATVTIPATLVSNNSVSPSISPSSINATSIDASSVNTTNPSYMPYNSTSENVLSFVEQNANNISYLKNKMDTLYKEVQDISGNVTLLNGSTAQIGKVSDVINETQAAIPTSPPEVSGMSQPPSTISSVTDYANRFITPSE